MVPDSLWSSGGVFRRVLVGYDGSTEAQHALQVAAALAADLRGEAHVLLSSARVHTPRRPRSGPSNRGRACEPLQGPQLSAGPDAAQL